MADNNRRTLIEDGTTIEGNVKSQCPIELCGKVEGELNAPSLSVTQSGSVSGKVKVKELRSQGQISGEIDADAVELSGKVQDDTVIQARTLEVKLDAKDGMQVSFGNCRLQVSGDRAGGQDQKSHKQSQDQQKDRSKQQQQQHANAGGHRHDRRK